MTLNCKKNDVAYVSVAAGPNFGRFVTCVRLIPDQLWNSADGSHTRMPTWELDSEIVAFTGERHRYCPDAYLRPIDNPGEHEVDQMVAIMRRKQGSVQRVSA